MNIYINGLLENSCHSESPSNNSSSVFIGAAAHFGPEYWSGIIDDVGFWNRELNESEISL